MKGEELLLRRGDLGAKSWCTWPIEKSRKDAWGLKQRQRLQQWYVLGEAVRKAGPSLGWSLRARTGVWTSPCRWWGSRRVFELEEQASQGFLRDDCGDQRQGSGLEAGVTWLQDCTYFSSLSKQTHIGKGFIFHLTSFRLQTILDHSPPSLTRVNAVCNAPAQNTWALPGNWGRGWAGGRYEGARMLFWKIWGHHVVAEGKAEDLSWIYTCSASLLFPIMWHTDHTTIHISPRCSYLHFKYSQENGCCPQWNDKNSKAWS